MKTSFTVLTGLLLLAAAGCTTVENQTFTPGKVKFTRLFSWGAPKNEEEAARYAAAGITDTIVHNLKQHDLAVKYGMRPYWKCFTPEGPWRQVMDPEEEKLHDYLTGKDLDPKLSRAEKRKIVDRRRIEKKHQYGGEAPGVDTLNASIKCFISDEDLVLSRKKLDPILDSAPEGTKGIYLDYFGYMNHRGCYCESCLRKYRQYLKDKNLPDTQENRDIFYRDRIIDYYARIIDHIKRKRPDFKVVVHIYPDFQPEHLYGQRTKADFCGQTVAWYFKWDTEKILQYTRFVVEHSKDHYPDAEGIPFLGINTNKQSSLGWKSPADVEREMKEILSAGGRTLMICNGRSIIEPGYFEVFKKYCGKE
ncbi:MAG: hypothetical protein IJS14_10035 [Lentisphaeria bacterium]|nr:hypothetical protein [Lentisphaeria bacterium]